MRTTTLPRPFGPISAFLTSGSIASVLVFGNMAVEAAEKEKKVAWKKDITKDEIPKTPAKGKVAGKEFTVENAKLSGGILKLRQGKDFFADLEFMIFTFAQKGTLEGKTFKVTPEQRGQAPHVYVKSKPKGENIPKSETFTSGYSLRLEFGKATKDGLPGSIYLCTPDETKSYVAGTFVAKVE